MKKYLILIALSLLVIIQFFGTLPPVTSSNDGDLIKNGIVDSDIGLILKTSCYDCHSNETNYPWYSYVAPVSWLVAHDVEEGREELNFSEWTNFSTDRKLKKLEEIGEEVEEGEMPLRIYTVTHGDASLSPEEKQKIMDWVKGSLSE